MHYRKKKESKLGAAFAFDRRVYMVNASNEEGRLALEIGLLVIIEYLNFSVDPRIRFLKNKVLNILRCFAINFKLIRKFGE